MGQKKVLIVLNKKGWVEIFQHMISQDYPKLTKITTFSTFFEEALDLISKEDSYVVVSCNEFFDQSFDRKKEHGAIIPYGQRDGAKLAQKMKEENSDLMFILFSQFNPAVKSEFIDEYVSQYHLGDLENMDVIKVLDLIHEFVGVI